MIPSPGSGAIRCLPKTQQYFLMGEKMNAIDTLRSTLSSLQNLKGQVGTSISSAGISSGKFDTQLKAAADAIENAIKNISTPESPAAASESSAASTTTVNTLAATDMVAIESAKTSTATKVAVKDATPAAVIAPINPLHPPYRVYDPSNPSAFAEKSNPDGGPNLLAADLMFNPDPRPNPPVAPASMGGEAITAKQISEYDSAVADNNRWNQKNIQIRTQTLLKSPYAAFIGYQGPNAAAAADPYFTSRMSPVSEVQGPTAIGNSAKSTAPTPALAMMSSNDGQKAVKSSLESTAVAVQALLDTITQSKQQSAGSVQGK